MCKSVSWKWDWCSKGMHILTLTWCRFFFSIYAPTSRAWKFSFCFCVCGWGWCWSQKFMLGYLSYSLLCVTLFDRVSLWTQTLVFQLDWLASFMDSSLSDPQCWGCRDQLFVLDPNFCSKDFTDWDVSNIKGYFYLFLWYSSLSLELGAARQVVHCWDIFHIPKPQYYGVFPDIFYLNIKT